jgi:MATE family multidrug resistance protein
MKNEGMLPVSNQETGIEEEEAAVAGSGSEAEAEVEDQTEALTPSSLPDDNDDGGPFLPYREHDEEGAQAADQTKTLTSPSSPDDDDNHDGGKASLTYQEHVSRILAITSPIVMAEIFQNTLPLVDIAFVGNLPGKNALAAAALATVWFNLWNSTMMGFMTAVDTYLAQAFGAKEYQSFSMWTGNSMIIVSVATIFISGFIALCEPCMVLFGQDPDLAAAAGQFSYRLIPGLIPYYAFKVLTKYLQTQNDVAPGVVIGLMANGFNVLANYLLIYKFGMGLNGAPWATTMTRFAEFILIAAYIRWRKPHFIDTFPSFSLENLRFRTIKPFVSLAFSGALSFACEAWSFEVTTILAGLLGTTELNAHSITLGIATFLYLSFPFAVGIATSIRVGQLIGDGCSGDAKRACLVSYAVNLIISIVLIAVLFPCSQFLGDAFSSDDEVSEMVATLIPLSCIFIVGDAISANTGGVMRGLGRQNLVLVLNIIAFWVLAIPIGALLTFVADVGVRGLWIGFSIGIYTAALIGILFLKRVNWGDESAKSRRRVSTL